MEHKSAGHLLAVTVTARPADPTSRCSGVAFDYTSGLQLGDRCPNALGLAAGTVLDAS